jgi:hypothetical protein
MNPFANYAAKRILSAIEPAITNLSKEGIEVSSINIDMVDVTQMGDQMKHFVIGDVYVHILKTDANGYVWQAHGRPASTRKEPS